MTIINFVLWICLVKVSHRPRRIFEALLKRYEEAPCVIWLAAITHELNRALDACQGRGLTEFYTLRTRKLLEKALESSYVRSSPWMWELYLGVEASCKSKSIKRVFYRAIYR